jgi:hypothetical protein
MDDEEDGEVEIEDGEVDDSTDPKGLYHTIQRCKELVDFRLRLAEIQEPDPADYFGNTCPSFSSSRLGFLSIPYKELPLNFRQVVSAIHDAARLEIRPAELKILSDAIGQKQKRGFEDDEEAVRFHLMKLELKRACYFAKWYRDTVREEFESCINVYGVQITSTATCVLVHTGHITAPPTSPAQVLQELIDDPTIIQSVFSPVFTSIFASPVHQKRFGTRLMCHINTRIPFGSKRALGIAIIQTRFIALLRWIERDSPPLADQEAELHFVSQHSRHCSHTCGQFLCLIHWTFESWQMNLSRDACKARAKELRKAGKPVPQYCDIHTPPCLCQLQALTAGEVLDIQFSTLYRKPQKWLRHKTPYPTAEISFPLKLSSRSPYDSTQQSLEIYDGELSSYWKGHWKVQQVKGSRGEGVKKNEKAVVPNITYPCPFPSCEAEFTEELRWNLQFYFHCLQDYHSHQWLPSVVKKYSPKPFQQAFPSYQ